MKRMNHLYDQIYRFEHLYAAAKFARRGASRFGDSLLRFCHELEHNLIVLADELKIQSYRPGPFYHFRIRDPKPRVISAAPFRDRVVHHALCALMQPRLEAYAIDDAYACRINKGQSAAMARCKEFMSRFAYVAKIDVHHFFETADHQVLNRQLRRLFKDQRLLGLAATLIEHGGTNGQGLPIGNLTSQHFAHLYLGGLDHYLKDELGLPGYVRYMDDCLLFDHCKARLRQRVMAAEAYVETHLKLRLRPDAERFSATSHGIPFLGFRVFPGLIRFDRARRRRALRKMKMLNRHGEARYGQDGTSKRMQSLCAWADMGQTKGLRRAWLKAQVE
jgi:RNA-directed DNA polymerase